MSGLRVLKPGALTTVQDGGRWGFQRFGVPVSGPMDPEAFEAANRLVGNSPQAAALEMTVQGGTFEADGPLVVAICGASMAPTLDGVSVPMWRSFAMASGQVLRLGVASAGARSYLAVAGGIAVPVVMGSRSTCLKGRFGGFEGRPLRAGDYLEAGVGGGTAGRAWPRVPEYGSSVVLRVLPGPEAGRFSLRALVEGAYAVTPQADRTGYRLSGPALGASGGGELLSEPVPVGTVQVPADGQPILLMADRQPTGGYARIAVVIAADLPLAGQLRPGHTIRFVVVGREEALQALGGPPGAPTPGQS